MDTKLIGAVLLSSVLLAPAGRAESLLPNATLAVRNPPSLPNCVDEAGLASRISAQLANRNSVSAAMPPLRLQVTIQRTLTALVAELRVSGRAGGVRQIEAARCSGLEEAMAVTMAMILDRHADETHHEAVANTAPNAAENAPAASTAPTAQNTFATESADAPARHASANHADAPIAASSDATGEQPSSRVQQGFRGIRLDAQQSMRAWLAGGWGSSKSWQFEVGGEFAVKRWATQLGAFLQPTHAIQLGYGHVDVTTMGAMVAECRRFGNDWRFVPCLRTMLGLERIVGVGYDQSPPRRLLTASFGPTLGVEYGNRWVLGADLIGQTALMRDNYVSDNPRETAKAPVFAVWLVARVALSSRSGSAATP